jgi:hypothetical protein
MNFIYFIFVILGFMGVLASLTTAFFSPDAIRRDQLADLQRFTILFFLAAIAVK